MNMVTISGGTAKKKKLVINVTNYMIKRLLPRFRTLDIDIHLSNLKEKEGVCGFCHSFTPREFIIEVDKKLDYYDLIETTCHEMIHVKQHARKELSEYNNGVVFWKNKKYDMNEKDYDDFPWEEEAYELEFSYARDYLNTLGANL